MFKNKNTLRIFFTSLLLISFFTLLSCGHKNQKVYPIAKNGLIYNSTTHKLFTGKIIDTSFVIIEFDVLNGVKNGRFTTYFLNGKTEKTGLIINNKNEGEWKYYYPSGKIKTIGNFNKDVPFGQWEFFYNNGNLKFSGSYMGGQKTGVWSYYNLNGKLINRLLYRRGVLLSIMIKNA